MTPKSDEVPGRTADALETWAAPAADPAKILLTGPAVLSMDPSVGDLESADILIEGNRILDIGSDLSAAAGDGQALVIGAADCIAIPGFQDTHRHCWQTQLRRLFPDASFPEYVDLLHGKLAYRYRPEDMYAGTLLAGLSALDSGITTVLDFCHNPRSPAHLDSVFTAWHEAGARAVVAVAGPPAEAEWGEGWRNDLERVRDEHCRDRDGRVSLRLGAFGKIGPIVRKDMELGSEAARIATELDIGITVDAVFGDQASAQLVELHREGLLKPATTYIHCTNLSDAAWEAIAESGGCVSLAVTSDAQLQCEDGLAPIQAAIDRSLKPALGIDVECCVSSDMFTQMKVALNIQRLMGAQAASAGEGAAAPPMSAKAMLECACINGAAANGVSHSSGSLTPGKAADVVLIRRDAVSNIPLNNAYGTVVLGADRADVDTVIVDGRPKKWAGELVDADVRRAGRLATESRDRLLEEVDQQLAVVSG